MLLLGCGGVALSCRFVGFVVGFGCGFGFDVLRVSGVCVVLAVWVAF